jgi:KaiC/GvpD/RAD55 family RecA-like ATPase
MVTDNQILAVLRRGDEYVIEAINAGLSVDWFESYVAKRCWTYLETLVEAKRWDDLSGNVVLAPMFKEIDGSIDAMSEDIPDWGFTVEEFIEGLSQFREEHIRKRTLSILQEGTKSLFDGEFPDDVCASVANKLSNTETVATERSLRDLASDALKLDTAVASGERVGLPFPWEDFQQRTFGIPLKAVTPLAGRDGKGKSRLAMYLSHFWLQEGIPGLYMPFEDGAERYMTAMAATHGKYDTFDLRRNNVPESFLMRHTVAMDELTKLPLSVDDQATTVESIIAKISKAKQKHNIEWVVVDGFKDIVRSVGENAVMQDNHMFASLKRAAHKYDVAILSIHHLTKLEDESWISKRDIKGSGELTQSSRMTLVYQDTVCAPVMDVYGTQAEDAIVLDCQKASYGDKGYVVLKPDLQRGSFSELRPC